MAWVFGGKKFGQYTYEHWFDDEEYNDLKTQGAFEETSAEDQQPEEEKQNKEEKNQ